MSQFSFLVVLLLFYPQQMRLAKVANLSGSSQHKCALYIADVKSGRILNSIEFNPVIGEEELTTRTLQLPSSKLIVTASVFYTDESMASKHGSDSIMLAIAVDQHPQRDAFTATNNAMAEVTLHGFDTARVSKTTQRRSRKMEVLMECRDLSE